MRCLVILLGCLVFQAWAGSDTRFIKLDESGRAVTDPARTWACVFDRSTGLVWEIKTETGWRSRKHTFSWRGPGVPAGTPDRGLCEGMVCNTLVYAQAVNSERVCGRGDWRLPEETELFTLFLLPGVVDTEFFPDTEKASYWSSTLGPDGRSPVFVAFYGKGVSYWHAADQPKRVRLVSGRPLIQE